MSDPLAERYRRIPYPALIHDLAHPAALAAVARLYGLSPADPAGARILELGCCRGDNLMSIAASLPGARCLGIDLVDDAIAAARRTAAERGLRNLRFEAGDLREIDLGGERFDYIIAYGLFTWVPEAVEERLLALCREHLSPAGIATIAFNVLPGCAWRQALRQLLLLEGLADADDEADSDARATAARRVLGVFERALPGLDSLPHTAALAQTVAALQGKPPALLAHDEGSPCYEPLYFLELIERAGEHGLAYVADADLRTDWLEDYPNGVREALAAAAMPRLKALQYADYLTNRGARRAILTCAEHAGRVLAAPDAGALAELCARSLLVPDPNARPRLPGGVVWHVPNATEPGMDKRLEVAEPLANAALARLQQADGGGPHLAAVLEEAARALGRAPPEPGERAAFAALVLRLAARHQVRLSYAPWPRGCGQQIGV